MGWNYQRNEDSSFTPLPVGDYRIRIKEVEMKKSSNGNDMLSFMFEVSGKKSKLFHQIVFLNDRPEITNRNLTQFFDAFPGIPDGDLNTQNWIGKVGAVHVKHEEYNGEMKAKVHYFIKAEKQGNLPPWVEPEKEMMGAVDSAPAQAAPNVDDMPPF